MKDFSFDVVVIGSGAAGLYAALCLPEQYRVALVTKDELKTGASDWAQGGIAAAINPDDSPLLHLEDTLKAGAGLCDRSAVQFLVENAASSIQSLVGTGVAFDRHNEHLAMTLEAAHSRPRVLHAADTTGRAIISTLTKQVLQRPNIEVFSQAFALSLWLNPDTGNCQGISLLHQGEINWLQAAAVVLATGGGGQVFAHTTNPTVSTGDGVALAWRSGAILRDLEFVQFHPTALSKPGAPRFLISEAVRGEGAHLIDSAGKRFAFDYHPDGELAPRDVVSRAIFTHLQKTNETNVYLDLRPIPEAKIRYRFPNIIRVCQKWGVDLFKEPIPVTPAAHYWMGGIAVDTMNQTSIPGLYAIGETASTGVHGANRLASNSLLECLVFSKSAVETAKEESKEKSYKLPEKSFTFNSNREIIFTSIQKSIQKLFKSNVGIVRNSKLLKSAIKQIDELKKYYTKEANEINQIKINNLIELSELIIRSALARKESRGAHQRSDYPEMSDEFRGNFYIHNSQIKFIESKWKYRKSI